MYINGSHRQDAPIADLTYVQCTESKLWQKLAYLLAQVNKRAHQLLHIAIEMYCISFWQYGSLSYSHAAHIIREFDSVGDVTLTLLGFSFDAEEDCPRIDSLGDVENLRIELLSCEDIDRILPSIGPHLAKIEFDELQDVTKFSNIGLIKTLNFPRLKSVKVGDCSSTDGGQATIASVLQALLSGASLGDMDEMAFGECFHIRISDFTAMLERLILACNHSHGLRTVTLENIGSLDILRHCEASLEIIASLLQERNGQLKINISIGEEFFAEWYMESVTTNLIPLKPISLSAIHKIRFAEVSINMLSDCPIILMSNLSEIEIFLPYDVYWTLAFHRFMSRIKAPRLRTLKVKIAYNRGIYARIVSILLWIPSTCVWHLHVILPRDSKESKYFESE